MQIGVDGPILAAVSYSTGTIGKAGTMNIDEQTKANSVAGLIPQTGQKAKSSPDESPTPFEEDMAIIREKGFRGYVEDLHKKKMEELREKILCAMGLDEEALENMPAEQRAKIEQMVSDEIQKRMAAESSMDKGEGAQWKGTSQPGEISQEVLAIRTGMGGAALALQAVMDNRDLHHQVRSPEKE